MQGGRSQYTSQKCRNGHEHTDKQWCWAAAASLATAWRRHLFGRGRGDRGGGGFSLFGRHDCYALLLQRGRFESIRIQFMVKLLVVGASVDFA